MNGDLLVQTMSHSFEAAKLKLVMGVKQREAFLNNMRLGKSFFIVIGFFFISVILVSPSCT